MTLDRRMRAAVNIISAAACLLAPPTAGAVAVVTVSDPWVRVAPDAKSAEAFMEVKSSEGATLVGVRSDVTRDVAVQVPGTKRATAPGIPLPAGTTVRLAPGAYRFVLAKLDHALKLGDRVAFELIVESADGGRVEIPVSAEVRRRSAYDDHLHPHSHAR